jgi:hypothetical protein
MPRRTQAADGIVIFGPFADRRPACDNDGMIRRFLRLLTALSVAAGLVSMPLAVPAHAHSAPPVIAGSDEMQVMAEDDMPCCPHEQKSKDCQDCPLLGFCLAKSTQIGPAVVAVLLDRTSVDAVLPTTDDAIADGLERPPPDHPPRILV